MTVPYQTPEAESWRLMTVAERQDILSKALDDLAQLSGNHDKAIKVLTHIFTQASHFDRSEMLTGATGESNELYHQARGLTLVVGAENAQILPVVVQLVSALLMGNQVELYFPSEAEVAKQIVKVLQKAGVTRGVLATGEANINDVRLAQVAVVGSVADVQQLAKQLSNTDGVLTQVIAVTDQVDLSEVFNPDYLQRFCTERVRTINTTAIGGNASLLELGVD